MSVETTAKKSALPIAIFTIVAFLLGIIGVRFLEYLNRDQSTVEQQRASVRLQTRQKLDAQDAMRLQATEWVDENRTAARIPINRAMEMMVTQLQLKPVVASSVEVPPPVEELPVDPAAGPVDAPVETPPGDQTEVPVPAESPNTPESPAIEGPATPKGVTDTPTGLESATTPQGGLVPQERVRSEVAPAGKVRPDETLTGVPADDSIPKADIQADEDAPVGVLPAPDPPGENPTPQSIMTPGAEPQEEPAQ